jgi:NitT/TauT family transport system substrate-binding protein
MAILGIALGMLATACDSPASGNTTSDHLTHITVAVVPITDAIPYFEAIKNGYFKQAGLDVTTKVTPQSTAATADLVRGSVQVIAAANYVNFFAGEVRGTLKIKVLAANSECGTDTQSVLALKGSGITGASSLVGKTIAVNINPNIQTLTIDEQLKANDISPSAVHFVEIPFPHMAAALAGHKVDAISEVEPFLSQTENSLGAIPVLQQCLGSTADIPLGGYISSAAWADSHRQIALAFQHAVERGQAYATANNQADEKIMPSFISIPASIAAVVNLNQYPDSLNAVQLQRVIDLMQRGGMLPASRQISVGPMLFH